MHLMVKKARENLPKRNKGTVSGRVLSLDAKEVVWEQPGLRFKGDFGWHIDFNKLLSGEEVFHDFYVQNVQSTVQSAQLSSAEEKVSESEKNSATTAQMDRRAPLPVHIQSIAFKDIALDIDGRALNLKALQSSFHWTGYGIDVPSIVLSGPWRNYTLTFHRGISTLPVDILLHLSHVVMHFRDN